jgi:hypothetical protein
MPLFIFGVVFLLVSALVLLSASQLLEQQRRLNGMSDSLALQLAGQVGQREISARTARVAMAVMYGEGDTQVDGLNVASSGRVSVRLCEPAKQLAAIFLPSGGVCSASAAQPLQN